MGEKGDMESWWTLLGSPNSERAQLPKKRMVLEQPLHSDKV